MSSAKLTGALRHGGKRRARAKRVATTRYRVGNDLIINRADGGVNHCIGYYEPHQVAHRQAFASAIYEAIAGTPLAKIVMGLGKRWPPAIAPGQTQVTIEAQAKL